jgi:pyridoxamine 5'-phosphate oxidase
MTRVAATRGSIEVVEDPIARVRAWLEEARSVIAEPSAMTLATATPEGRPSARVVLLQGLDERGLTFFTNRTSRKADELASNPHAAIVLHWWELGRQIRIEGSVEQTTDTESQSYWETRPRGSQVAAWASRPSRSLSGRDELEMRVREAEERFAGAEVPLPPFWGGYRLVPTTIELWTHRDDRLHDRVLYVREGDRWRSERLAP